MPSAVGSLQPQSPHVPQEAPVIDTQIYRSDGSGLATPDELCGAGNADDVCESTYPRWNILRRLCCRPLLPKCRWRCYLGPLFYHEQSEEMAELEEAELQAPYSLFHPVPTSPVFGPRYDYEPPQLMMVPVDHPGWKGRLHEPGTLAAPPELQPIDPQPEPPVHLVPESQLRNAVPPPPSPGLKPSAPHDHAGNVAPASQASRIVR